MYNFVHEIKYRYRWNSTHNNSLPFLIKITLPHPRKARKILERDNLGRIIYAQPL